MTAAVSPRCACGHVGFRHLADHGCCQARYCHCVRFHADEPIPARFDERYDPSPYPIDRSIQ